MFPLSFLLILFSPTTALQSETFPSFPVPNPVAVFALAPQALSAQDSFPPLPLAARGRNESILTLPFDSHQREEQDPLGVAMPFTCIRCTFSVPSLLAFPDSSLFLIHYLSSSFSFPLFRTALFYYKQRGEQKPPQTAIAIFLFLLLLCVIYLIAVSGPSPCGLIRERE